MPSSDIVASRSKSGIQTSATGDSYIPSSTRADGSKRKEIRVRPGYRPPEDVEVYKNRTAEAWKHRGRGGVPGAESVPHNDNEIKSEAQSKNAKRREARRKAAAATKATEPDLDTTGANIAHSINGLQIGDTKSTDAVTLADEETEKEKKARSLRKKLKQAKELRQKRDQGETLLPEQFTKVMKIHELIRELDRLGFDADGVKREKQPEAKDGG